MPQLLRAAQPPVLPRSVLPRHVEEDASDILARPLFSTRRRPAPASAVMGAVGPGRLPRLSGIIIARSHRRAIFDSDGKSLGGSVGDHAGPYTIVAIAPQRVTVTGPAGEQVLTLRFGVGQPAPPPRGGPSIMDRLRDQHYRPPPLPSAAALQRLLHQQQGQPR